MKNENGKSFVGYVISVGDISNFDRKLEEAQKELGINVLDYIPVSYKENSKIWGYIFVL